MPSPVLTATAKRLLPWLVAVAFFMESLDTTILNTAVPTMAAALHVAPLSMKSVLTSYTLSLAVFIPISGWVADRFGTRRVFAAAIGVFTLGSLCCGLCSNIHLLVASRVLQGCGGALMVPVGRLTLVRAFPRSELVRAMSFVAIPGLIGPLVGPLAGGLIVGYLHWRLIFFVNLPIGLLGLYLVYLHLPDYRAETSDPLDFVGLVLFGSGVALLSYVLEIFGEHTLSGPEMIGLLAISLLLLAAYWYHGSHLERPLLRLTLFKIRTFRTAVTGELRHPPRHRRPAVSSSPPLSGRPRLHSRAIRTPHHAAAPGGHGPQVHHAPGPPPLWLSLGSDRQYRAHHGLIIALFAIRSALALPSG